MLTLSRKWSRGVGEEGGGRRGGYWVRFATGLPTGRVPFLHCFLALLWAHNFHCNNLLRMTRSHFATPTRFPISHNMTTGLRRGTLPAQRHRRQSTTARVFGSRGDSRVGYGDHPHRCSAPGTRPVDWTLTDFARPYIRLQVRIDEPGGVRCYLVVLLTGILRSDWESFGVFFPEFIRDFLFIRLRYFRVLV